MRGCCVRAADRSSQRQEAARHASGETAVVWTAVAATLALAAASDGAGAFLVQSRLFPDAA